MIYSGVEEDFFNSNIVVGYGKSHASFGELVQGRLSNQSDFLVTLPIDMWSICHLTCIKRKGPLLINSHYEKSKMVAFKLLEKLEILKDFEITISFSRNIPIGKGLSSSTADMLSTIRALQEVFGFLLRNNTISEIFTSIEPHDGLMHKSSVVYDHRKGRLINDLKYIPQYWIIGVDFGGEVNTVKYNKHLKISEREVEQYDQLYDKLIESFNIKDDIAIADCATRSCKLYCERTKDNNRVDLLNIYRNFDSLGVVNTHSGTCVGLLYPGNLKVGEISKIAKSLKKEINLSVFVTHTLKLLN